MGKKLSEMTIEELWELFPIVLTEHRSEWKEQYEEEKKILSNIVPKDARISHIGSTAIDGIWAKPIVDILIEIPRSTDMEKVKIKLVENGYICMSESEERKSFNKGYTEEGFADKVFHIHLRFEGDCDEIFFRDYLNGHKDEAKEYERLKLGLWKEYEHDRDGYTNAKAEFIQRIMKRREDKCISQTDL